MGTFSEPEEGPLSCPRGQRLIPCPVPKVSEILKHSPKLCQHIHMGNTGGAVLLCDQERSSTWIQRGGSFSLTVASELSRAPAPHWCACGETGVCSVNLLL